EVFPRDAGLEDEEDAGEGLAIAHGLAAGVAEAARLGGRQQRLDDLPQLIGDERLGHENTSGGAEIRPQEQRGKRHTPGLILLVLLMDLVGLEVLLRAIRP